MFNEIFNGMTYYEVECDSKEEAIYFVQILQKNLCPIFEIKDNVVICMIIDRIENKIEKMMDEYNGLI